MVIGCIVFTLPHFLSPDNNGGILDESLLKSDHEHENSYTLNDRLTTNPHQNENPNKNNTLYTYANYNLSNAELNETIVSLRQTSNAKTKQVSRQGRNSICHSVNPQSSPFIQGATSRLNSDLNSSPGIHKSFISPSFSLHDSSRLFTLSNICTYIYITDGENKFPSVKQELMSVGCSVEVIDKDGEKTTQFSQGESYGHPLILFMIAMVLLGCGGSPLFTLGITYVDDHVPESSSSVYIGKDWL